MSIIGSPVAGCISAWPRVERPNSARPERVTKSRRFTRLYWHELSVLLMRTRAYASVLLIAVAVFTGHRSQGQRSSPRPWPPPLQDVSNESPPRSPADALQTFFLPPGYAIELVASEPLVQDPVAIDWDLDGRDRKSTRLNSSHLGISYAAFCL